MLAKVQKGYKFLLKKIKSTHYVLHNYKVSRNSVERFQRSCTDELFRVASLILVNLGHYSQKKKLNQNFLWIYAHLHIMSFITTKFQEILLSGFKWVGLTRKTGLMDGSKTLYPPQLIAWGAINLNILASWFIYSGVMKWVQCTRLFE